jgi:glycosyltransferase involved in cell wall biosynthesis
MLQAGRLIEKKGLVTSLQAFATFQEKYPAATLTIAGEGPQQKRLEEMARDLRIENRVRFAGFLSQAQLRNEFYQAHIFLHPSELGADGNQEGVPNSILEAMASGLPVFATRHGGIPEAVEHEVSGILVNERDPSALAQSLVEWVGRPRDLERLAQSGSHAVASRFEQAAQARALEDIYFEALNQNAPGASVVT